MPADTPTLARDEGLDVIADWLRDLSSADRAALSRQLVNDATNHDPHPTSMHLGRALAPVLMRMDLGDDPRPLLPENLGYGGGLTEVELRRALDALLGKATVVYDVVECLRSIDANEAHDCAELMRARGADPLLSVTARERCMLVAAVLDAMARGDDPLDALELFADNPDRHRR